MSIVAGPPYRASATTDITADQQRIAQRLASFAVMRMPRVSATETPFPQHLCQNAETPMSALMAKYRIWPYPEVTH